MVDLQCLRSIESISLACVFVIAFADECVAVCVIFDVMDFRNEYFTLFKGTI